MTPADKRITELLDRWLASIELHLKYAALDEAAYRQIQPWPEHERPSRWILEIAQQKVLQLRSLSHMHAVQQDGSFAEGLELMCFLANLVGAQNIKRFIPLADPAREQPLTEPSPNISANAPAATPAPPTTAAAIYNPAPASSHTATQPAAKTTLTSLVLDVGANDAETREMPLAKTSAPSTTATDSTREMPRLKIPSKKAEPVRQPEPPQKRSHGKHPAAAKTQSATTAAPSSRLQEVVIADAVRLLKWGKEWHELADLIARMAERPGASEVRRILKTQRVVIEEQLTD